MFVKHSGKGILMVAAAAAWAAAYTGGAAMAQQPGNMQQPSPGQQQQMPGQQGSPEGPTSTTGMPDTSQGQQPGSAGYADQAFVHDTLEANAAQVAMSQLAAQKSSSDDVKQFSQKMVEVHTALTNQLRPAAKELGMSEPKGPSKKQQKEIDRLQALNGPDFDTAYIQAMAKQQQHDLKEFKDEAQAGQTSNIKQAAQQDAPILQQHFDILQKLAQAHNVTLESKN